MNEEWVCEQHPEFEFGHDGCAGPGVLKEEQMFYMCLQRRNALQKYKEAKAFYEEIIYGLYNRILQLEELQESKDLNSINK